MCVPFDRAQWARSVTHPRAGSKQRSLEWGRCRLRRLVENNVERRLFHVDKAPKTATSPLEPRSPLGRFSPRGADGRSSVMAYREMSEEEIRTRVRALVAEAHPDHTDQ